jgi:hypothetical protein
MGAVLALCVFAFGANASPLHLHAYVDHDHEEHHHGPASHDHDASVEERDEAPHVSACEPADHIVRISYIATPTTDVHPVVGEVVLTAVMLHVPDSVRAVQILDVRGHSPPQTRVHSLRGPPLHSTPVRRSA